MPMVPRAGSTRQNGERSRWSSVSSLKALVVMSRVSSYSFRRFTTSPLPSPSMTETIMMTGVLVPVNCC